MPTYTQPKPVPVPNTAGYPNNVPATQTKPMRGAGAAQTGNKYSKHSQ
jgi:hypothetical protein